jgi:hypothetical protein
MLSELSHSQQRAAIISAQELEISKMKVLLAKF